MVSRGFVRLPTCFMPPTAVTDPTLLIRADQEPGTQDAEPALGLSPRERGVLALLESGASNAEMADALVVSQHSVHRHL
jgi:ATP/maltotriose-dependent transcriptional regulator MalT